MTVLAVCGSSLNRPGVALGASPSLARTNADVWTGAARAHVFDSCSVVSRSEASRALGQRVTPGILGNATVEGGLACVFYGPTAAKPRNPNVAQGDSVRVVVVKGPNALKWYKDYKSKVKAVRVTGYGKQAFYDGYASLSVLKGNYYLRLAVVGTAPSPLAAEKRLAAMILPKLR
jgi:hypothetical protein